MVDAQPGSGSSRVLRSISRRLYRGAGVVVGLVILVAGIVTWNSTAYNDIRSAAEDYEPPEAWTLLSTEFSGSHRLATLIWASDFRRAELTFTTDQTGVEACEHGAASLREFSGLDDVRVYMYLDSAVSPANFCDLAVHGEFHGIDTAFIRVTRKSLGDRSFSEDTVSTVEVVLREPVEFLR